jgi:hypothetical protein
VDDPVGQVTLDAFEEPSEPQCMPDPPAGSERYSTGRGRLAASLIVVQHKPSPNTYFCPKVATIQAKRDSIRTAVVCRRNESRGRSGSSVRGEGPEDGLRRPSRYTPSREGRGLGRFTVMARLVVRKFPQIATPEPSGVQEQTYHGLW